MKRARRATTSTRWVTDALLGKKSKYGATATVVDGRRFASKKEARRYQELKLLETGGRITNLRCQVRYTLVQTVVYVADFVYDENGAEVVEDVKGFKTAVYKRKKRLMAKQHKIEIRET